MAGAFEPSWSPDGQWIAFGLGEWFQERHTGKARIMRVRRDGTRAGSPHRWHGAFGVPKLFRGRQADRLSRLGREQCGPAHPQPRGPHDAGPDHCYDNLPGWSPDGSRILFTRRVDAVNFDIFTIRPDGSDLLRLTTNRATDGHAVWTADGRIMWNSGIYGFRDEAALYDNTFQQYGQIFIMNADGSGKRMLTDSRWEDSMPLYIPAKFL